MLKPSIQTQNKNVKVNLSLPVEFYLKVEKKAHKEYLPVATMLKQIILKNLNEGDKLKEKCITPNGNNK
ncbi:hypothetical protein INQ51_17140 [Maribellus sp. CM-23]|uniref:hypothetical protein n=1 Tax=Maribellus sp. CM-23 TaxID=2781026 RepID=UPI001F424648|nr:hypothetical protein [Maribellus sp. CM-23]MCE4566048.1 hypothetical protein [Maribellus sp. CM-23]